MIPSDVDTKHYIATFHTQSAAIKCDRYLKTKGQKSTLKPVPRALSSSCGICIEFSGNWQWIEAFEDVEKVFEQNTEGYTCLLHRV